VKTHQQYFWRHCPECHEARKSHLLKFGSFPTGSINLGFITEGRLAVVLITPSLGVPNWSVIYINTAPSMPYMFIVFSCSTTYRCPSAAAAVPLADPLRRASSVEELVYAWDGRILGLFATPFFKDDICYS
jgi:hypothetical protein